MLAEVGPAQPHEVPTDLRREPQGARAGAAQLVAAVAGSFRDVDRVPQGALVRAVTYSAYGIEPVLAEVPEPACPPGGVLVAVAATGVCRSDWHAWMGHDPVSLPHVPGHELAGTVAAVGAGVTRRRVGDRVTVPFACGCGQCEVCRAGDTHVCPTQTQPGFTYWGSFADLVAVHAADTNVVELPEAVGFVEAAALGCRFATAYRAVAWPGAVTSGEWVAIHGCGGVGLSAVMVAVALGARVVAVDVTAAALERAVELGAEAVVFGGPGVDVVAAVRGATGGGAHLSIDALGSRATALASIGSLRPRGRHVQVGLLLGDDAVLSVPMGPVIGAELSILGSHGMPASDYPALLRLVASGVLRPADLVVRVVGLDEAGAALSAMSGPPAAVGVTIVQIAR